MVRPWLDEPDRFLQPCLMNIWVFSTWNSFIFKYNLHVVQVLYMKHCYTLFQPNKRYTSAVHAAILDKYSSSAVFPSISAGDCEMSILLQSITVRHGTLYWTDLYTHVAPNYMHRLHRSFYSCCYAVFMITLIIVDYKQNVYMGILEK